MKLSQVRFSEPVELLPGKWEQDWNEASFPGTTMERLAEYDGPVLRDAAGAILGIMPIHIVNRMVPAPKLEPAPAKAAQPAKTKSKPAKQVASKTKR